MLEAYRIYHDFPVVFSDYIYLMVLTGPALTYFNYHRQKYSKNFFLYQKKIHAMNFEHTEIIKNLPDGAVIHKIENVEVQEEK